MKLLVSAPFILLASASESGDSTNPLAKVYELLKDIKAKVREDGDEADKAYNEYFEWCDDTTKEAGFQIESATRRQNKLVAEIDELNSVIETSESRIEDLAATISKNEGEVKGSVEVRAKENANFKSAEAELTDTIDTLRRAIEVLEREAAKNPSLAQLDKSDMPKVLKMLGTVIEAAGFSGGDSSKLLAMVQEQQEGTEDDEDEDMSLGAPAPAVYQSKGGGIVEVMQDMQDKAEESLAAARKEESNSKHNFEMLNQGLLDEIAQCKKDMDVQKQRLAAGQESKGTAEGDLELAKKDQKAGQTMLETTRSDCIQTAADHQTSLKQRAEEIMILSKAEKILAETTGQADSFMQMSSESRTSSKFAAKRTQLVQLIKGVAKTQHSHALQQLASKVQALMQYNSRDVFGKVKGLITDMIAKLEQEAAEDETEKKFCDEELAKTEKKDGDLNDDLKNLADKIDSAASRSAELKGEVADLQANLAALMKQQASMDKVRADEHSAFLKSEAELKRGLNGITEAIKVLREYYESKDEDGGAFVQTSDIMGQPAPPAKAKKQAGAGGGVIDMLEVIQSDFAKGLAVLQEEEEDEQTNYETETQKNKLTKAEKDQDVKFKTKEFKSLDNAMNGYKQDSSTVQSELDAVTEYFSQIKARCIAQPSSYEEVQKRRTAEIKGLKEALDILESETAFTQRAKHALRGVLSTD
jgi:ABC-type transporter Mla subunit MlaD